MDKIISLDAETDGLYGPAIAIAATMHDSTGAEIPGGFLGRCPDTLVKNEWVKENVLPTLGDVPVIADSSEILLNHFINWWLHHSDGATVIFHMGMPVEAGLFIRARESQFMGDFDGPYAPIDVAAMLHHIGEESDSVDKYADKYDLKIPQGKTHNPRYDCLLTAATYYHIMSRKIS